MLFSKQLIATKLKIPRIGLDIINRSRPLSLFADYDKKSLTLLSAPPGFGKTILTWQFLRKTDIPFLWYQLDDNDNDPHTFFQYLITGISTHFSEFSVFPQNYSFPIDTDLQKLLALLISTFDNNTGYFILVFDNYHAVKNPLIHHFMQELIQYLPANVHIIIMTRGLFPVNISKQKLNGLVSEIGAADLQFDINETKVFFTEVKKQNITEETIKEIQLMTEGWPAAVTYFSLKGRICSRIPSQVYEYINNEIFLSLPQELQNFLVLTSVLNKIDGQIADYLLDRNDAAVFIDEIQNANLPVTFSEQNSKEFCYHILLKSFLQDRLGNTKTKLLNKAGCYYKNSHPEEAVAYFITADNYPAVHELVEKIGIAIIQQGQLDTVSKWLDYILSKKLNYSASIVLLKGALLSYRGLFDEAELWIDKAVSAFNTGNDKTGLFHAIIHKARILRYRATYEESLKYIDKLIPLLNVMPVEQLYDVIVEKSYNLWLTGHADTAINIAEQAMNTAEKRGDLKTAAQIARYMTVLFYHTGDFTNALENYEKSTLRYMSNSDALERHTVDSFIARIYRDKGELEKALNLMLLTLENKQSREIIEDISNIYYQMATIYLDMKDYKKALEYLKRAKDSFKKTGGTENNAFFKLIQALEGRLIAETGDLLSGKQMIDNAVDRIRGESDFMLVVAQFFAAVIDMRLHQFEEARNIITEALQTAEKIGMKLMISQCSGLLASILRTTGQTDVHYAEQCLSLAAKEHYMQMFVTFPEFMPCLMVGLENHIEADFIDEIVIRLGDEAITPLLGLVKSSKPETRLRCSNLLAQLGGQKVISELEILIYDSDKKVRDHALKIMQQLTLHEKRDDSISQKNKKLLFVRCFGEFEVFSLNDQESPLKWRTAKAKELFAYLMYNHRHTVSKEKIISDIWPDLETHHASSLLHTNLFYVRKMLKSCGIKNGIHFKANGYSLELGEVSCDEAIFCKLLDDINKRSMAENGLEQVISIYRGLYLEEWDWAEEARRNFNTLYCSALENLASYYYNLKNYKKAENYLKGLLQADPYKEAAHQMLMKTYAMRGNKIGISLHYKYLCRLLKEELEVDPDEKTRDLYRQLSEQKPNLS